MSNKVSRAFFRRKNNQDLVSLLGLGYNAPNAKHCLYFFLTLCLLDRHYAWSQQYNDTQHRQPFWLEEKFQDAHRHHNRDYDYPHSNRCP